MTTDQFGVGDEVAIVTGASSGIGRTIAERFAADGADVVICSRAADRVDHVADGIAEGPGGDAVAVECDVRDRDAVDAMIETAVERFGTVTCLVNNAGASFMAPFAELSENAWKTIVDINLHGTFHCSQAAGAVMRGGDGGAIVNVASVSGLRGSPMMSHYSAAKAGVIRLTATLAYEWAHDDVRVNCVAPGFVATPGVETQMGVSAGDLDRADVARRIGTTEEVADVVQFLASPAASYLTGETIAPQGVPRLDESTDVPPLESYLGP